MKSKSLFCIFTMCIVSNVKAMYYLANEPQVVQAVEKDIRKKAAQATENAIKIQAFIRGVLAKRAAQATKNAIKIQAFIRGVLAKRAARARRGYQAYLSYLKQKILMAFEEGKYNTKELTAFKQEYEQKRKEYQDKWLSTINKDGIDVVDLLEIEISWEIEELEEKLEHEMKENLLLHPREREEREEKLARDMNLALQSLTIENMENIQKLTTGGIQKLPGIDKSNHRSQKYLRSY